MRLTTRVALVVLLGLGETRASASDRTNWDQLIVADGPRAAAERQALSQALRLLPRVPARVAVIDPEAAKPDVKATLLGLDAFIVKGSNVIYVVRQSALLRGAATAQGFHTFALAAVLWHEMAHAEGHDESEARRREQELWTTFIRDQRIDQLTALRYLQALSRRPDVQVSATREPAGIRDSER
jgi:hypothetical protein